jgi:hypothetical protein
MVFVEIDGSQVNLGPDKEEAERKVHELLAERPQLSADHLAVILDKYLPWVQGHRSAATFRWYTDFLQSFVSAYPKLRIRDLKPHMSKSGARENPNEARSPP